MTRGNLTRRNAWLFKRLPESCPRCFSPCILYFCFWDKRTSLFLSVRVLFLRLCCKFPASLPGSISPIDQNCSVFVISCRSYCFVPGNVYDEIRPRLLILICLSIFLRLLLSGRCTCLDSCNKKIWKERIEPK